MNTAFTLTKRALRAALLVLLLGAAGTVNAQTFTVGNLNYSVNEGTQTVTVTGHVDGTSASGSLTIPESVDYGDTNYAVTAIGDEAFKGCVDFTGSLIIPNSVTTIGRYAFYNCGGLNGTLTLGDAVTTIGNYAFTYCSNFTGSLIIPDALTTIGSYAFLYCSNLTGSLVIPNSVTTIGEGAFVNCSGFTGDLVIPDAVITIGRQTFDQCTGFTGNLIIGNHVETIGIYAFDGCTGFTGSLVIPNSVTTIGIMAFRNCFNFDGSLILGDAVETILDKAFEGCTGFSSIESLAVIPPTLGADVFNGWSSTTSVYVPCGSGPDYSGWGGFSNIIDLCTIYVKDVMLLGGSESEVNALLPDRLAEGWHLINNDLNAGCGSGTDYIYLLYKSEATEGVNLNYVTGFYISNAGGTAPNSLTYDDRTYYLVPYDGGNHFKNKKGDLNSNAGGDDIHLYYTKDVFSDNRAVTEITFNATQSGALGVNGGTTGYDLNSGAGGDYIYMHVTKEVALVDPEFAITTSANPSGGGTLTGAGTYHYGDTCTLTATPAAGYIFLSWTKNGTQVSTNPNYTFIVTGNRTFVAQFQEQNYTINVSASPTEGGMVSGAGIYGINTTCTLTATANTGYYFLNWTQNGQPVSDSPTYSFNVTDNCNLVANFEVIPVSGVVAAYYPNSSNSNSSSVKVSWNQTPPDVFYVDFDDSQVPAGWTIIDGGDPVGYGWCIASTKFNVTGQGHNGSADFMLSQSYDNNYGVVYPDNWLISPQVNLGTHSQFSLWACGQDANYAAEHFGVFVSTTGTNPEEFTKLAEWTLTARGQGAPTKVTRSGNRSQGNWYQYTVDLGAYAGSACYIAIRHFNCSNNFYLDVDDIALTNGAQGRDATITFRVYRSKCNSGGSSLVADNVTGNEYIDSTWSNLTAGSYKYGVCTQDSDTTDIVWSNCIEKPYQITATANPTQGGTVSGGGNFTYGQSCTLTATANTGYAFVNWTQGTAEVTTEATFSFTVTQDSTFVANFEQVPDLTTQPDTLDLGYRPAGAWMRPYQFTLTSNNTQTTISMIDFTPSNGLLSFDLGELELPFVLDQNESATIGLAWGDQPGSMDGSLVVIYSSAEATRSAEVFPVEAEIYVPALGDVWETAKVVNAFPYTDTLNADTLYSNYVLPYPNIPNGSDVVYRLEFDHDVLLNADLVGSNGKLALYAEGFEDFGGPDLDNYLSVSPEPIDFWFNYNYTSNNTWYGVLNGSGLWFGYKIPAEFLAGFGQCYITAVEAAAHESYPYNLYVFKGGETPNEATMVYSQEMTENPEAMQFFIMDINTPFAIGETEDVWVIFYSDSPFPAYSGKGPEDPTNAKIWYSENGTTWNSNEFCTPEIHVHLQYPKPVGRGEVVLDLADMSMSPAQSMANDRGASTYLIEGLNVPAGTYYLVASSTSDTFSVAIDTMRFPYPPTHLSSLEKGVLYDWEDLHLIWDEPEGNTPVTLYRVYKWDEWNQDFLFHGNADANEFEQSGLQYDPQDSLYTSYYFKVSAWYEADSLESALTDAYEVRVYPVSMASGHVLEQDSVTGIADATVNFMAGERVFSSITDADGAYSVTLPATIYDYGKVWATAAIHDSTCYDSTLTVPTGLLEDVDFILRGTSPKDLYISRTGFAMWDVYLLPQQSDGGRFFAGTAAGVGGFRQ